MLIVSLKMVKMTTTTLFGNIGGRLKKEAIVFIVAAEEEVWNDDRRNRVLSMRQDDRVRVLFEYPLVCVVSTCACVLFVSACVFVSVLKTYFQTPTQRTRFVAPTPEEEEEEFQNTTQYTLALAILRAVNANTTNLSQKISRV